MIRSELNVTIERLNIAVKSNLPNIFFSQSLTEIKPQLDNYQILDICRDIVQVIEAFLDEGNNNIDIRQDNIHNFLKVTLPYLIEAIVRRKTLRYLI